MERLPSSGRVTGRGAEPPPDSTGYPIDRREFCHGTGPGFLPAYLLYTYYTDTGFSSPPARVSRRTVPGGDALSVAVSFRTPGEGIPTPYTRVRDLSRGGSILCTKNPLHRRMYNFAWKYFGIPLITPISPPSRHSRCPSSAAATIGWRFSCSGG